MSLSTETVAPVPPVPAPCSQTDYQHVSFTTWRGRIFGPPLGSPVVVPPPQRRSEDAGRSPEPAIQRRALHPSQRTRSILACPFSTASRSATRTISRTSVRSSSPASASAGCGHRSRRTAWSFADIFTVSRDAVRLVRPARRFQVAHRGARRGRARAGGGESRQGPPQRVLPGGTASRRRRCWRSSGRPCRISACAPMACT